MYERLGERGQIIFVEPAAIYEVQRKFSSGAWNLVATGGCTKPLIICKKPWWHLETFWVAIDGTKYLMAPGGSFLRPITFCGEKSTGQTTPPGRRGWYGESHMTAFSKGVTHFHLTRRCRSNCKCFVVRCWT